MKNILAISISALILVMASCGKPVPLDVKLKVAMPQVSIYGRLDNNDFTNDYIRVEMSTSYLNPADSSRVPDASVLVKDEDGKVWTFSYVKMFGVYLPPSEYKGVEIGKTYTMEVMYKGITYVAQSKVLPFSASNNTPFVKDSIEKKDGSMRYFGDTTGYVLTEYLKDDPNYKNYYHVEVTRNDTLVTQDDGNIFVYTNDDQLLNDAPEGTPLQFFQTFKKNDKVRVDAFNIDFDAFKYIEAVGIQANNGGTIFDGPPANIRGNISNGALGYFLTAASFSDTLTIGTK